MRRRPYSQHLWKWFLHHLLKLLSITKSEEPEAVRVPLLSKQSLSSNWPADANISEKLASLLQGEYAICYPHLFDIKNNILHWWIEFLPATLLVLSDETLGGTGCVG